MPRETRVFILRVRRDGRILEAAPDLVLERDDVVAVVARYEAHVTRGDVIGPEISDLELLDIPVEALDVVVTNKLLAGKTLALLAQAPFARGIFLSRITRSGIEVPVSPETRVDRGDVLRIIGPLPEVDRASKALGYADRKTSATDMVFVGTGIFLGGLVGLLSVVVVERAPHLDGERRRPGDGSRVRLAAVRLPLFRADSRAGHLDLRHPRPVHVHWHRRPERRPKLRRRASRRPA